jgi:nitrogen fixation/metabolism regulation signal transduction histidine kinase
MVFNSYTFLFYFLPIVVLGFFLVGKLENKTACLAWLLAASIMFYICNSALDVFILATGYDEISVLVELFNRMTCDLRENRAWLIQAGADLEKRWL